MYNYLPCLVELEKKKKIAHASNCNQSCNPVAYLTDSFAKQHLFFVQVLGPKTATVISVSPKHSLNVLSLNRFF